ncbi:MAG TPA: lytic transglycosylase domain-containing protein [Acidobacteriaceae bacterium]|nr:lytic transglycosylase domain-containing protein [Acidobacteriaceae bacterium]
MLRTRNNSACVMAAFVVLSAALPVMAAERLTLANGFDLVCNHHETVGDRIRVYPKADDANYFELKPEAVTGYETVPDPPVPSLDKTAAGKNQNDAQMVSSHQDAKLTAADLHQLLSKAGQQHNVDEDLLASLVKAESNGNVRATSRAGARGLMQLMPGTAHQLGVADSFAPDENVQGGTAYLDSLLTRYRDNITLALAAYNAGPEAVDRYHGIPPYHETRVYVARVVHEFNRRVKARNETRMVAIRASNAGQRTASVTRSATQAATQVGTPPNHSTEMGNE